MDNGMIPIREYVAANGNRCPRTVADVLLRQLPEAVARWRSEQLSPCGRLREEFIKVDAMSGYVEITAPCADEVADESDDVQNHVFAANVLCGLVFEHEFDSGGYFEPALPAHHARRHVRRAYARGKGAERAVRIYQNFSRR